MSQSATIFIMFLMRHYEVTYETAFSHTKR
jgi:hypothetical protein